MESDHVKQFAEVCNRQMVTEKIQHMATYIQHMATYIQQTSKQNIQRMATSWTKFACKYDFLIGNM